MRLFHPKFGFLSGCCVLALAVLWTQTPVLTQGGVDCGS